MPGLEGITRLSTQGRVEIIDGSVLDEMGQDAVRTGYLQGYHEARTEMWRAFYKATRYTWRKHWRRILEAAK